MPGCGGADRTWIGSEGGEHSKVRMSDAGWWKERGKGGGRDRDGVSRGTSELRWMGWDATRRERRGYSGVAQGVAPGVRATADG